MDLSVTQTIDRPVNAVFRIAADPARFREWQPDVTMSYASEDRLRVGVMLTQNRRATVAGMELHLNADIIDYKPNRLIGYRGVLGRLPMTAEIAFESDGTRTHITESLNVRTPFPYGLFSPFLRRALTRRTRAALAALKQLVESEAD